MDIKMKWFYRLGFLLLLFIVIFVFIRLQEVWIPVIKIVLSVLTPFIIASFITYLLHPVVEKLHETGLHRGVAIVIIYILFFGGAGFTLYKAIPAIILQLKDLTEHAPEVAEQYRTWIEKIHSKTHAWPNGFQERIDSSILAVEKTLDQILSKTVNSLVKIVNSLLMIAIIPFITFYMLKDYDVMKKAVWYLTPRKWRQQGILFLRDVDKSLGGYIRGQMLVCAIIGSCAALLFWFAGIKYPLLLGIIVGLTNVIPYFGPIIGAVPAVIIAVTMSVKMAVIAIIIVFSLQFLEGNILSPLIVGKSLHMHPLMIIFALLSGGEIGGILGLILAVPVLAVLKVALLHAKDHMIRANREMETKPNQ
ncbi:hypothetical protein PB1_15524 [Bacillus methanolicus PB1]|uniref:AI-2E family transporter n=1 Tax=Bacillus methanolicus PB1 TaxID=997296 RepID=I3DXL0_BACMT|nr:AI-2E family transporter [Bacillus methanolicus]EIJ78981.1 hypothetical protein PB1_15524 [Bacillus methanolicus PB1]